MRAEDALASLGKIAASFAEGEDLSRAAPLIVDLAFAAYPARSAFVAQSEGETGLALRWLFGRERDGKVLDPLQQARVLHRVESALREVSAGVRETPPPEQTGGPPPEGAIAVKTEAGNPPLYCFALRDKSDKESDVLGVLGLGPDPVSHGEPDGTAMRALRVACDLARARLRGELERDRGRALIEAALGTPPGEGQESEPAADPRGFKYAYKEIVTRSPRMFEIFRRLDKIIHLNVPVLIGGGTGTGKELIARAIHDNGPRKKRRFYAQNCAAIAPSLLESELFGYEKGAFTGADKYKKGLFEIASGSTLFLDEIGEMDLEMQKKLLRVLQEGEVQPLGTSTPVKVDVRIVCATNRDLAQEVAEGRFREDLYHRLNVVKVDLPPLRDRPEDVPYLVDHFLKKTARARGERPKVLDRRDPRIMKRLTEHPWPGNVRQLDNVMTRAAHLSGEVITWDVLAEDPEFAAEIEKAPAAFRPVRPLDTAVEQVEREEIANALKQTNGNRTRAAAMLKINRRSLLRRLKKYGLASEEDSRELGADEAVDPS
ncbi:sigma-54-dependent Fis family transcriptional regulator [bacterium]|nr:sigma-54-dependent Fis family transcriptional regulator [bacterium]